jgi:non-ribosomal peptide synthase protein (TIGR01720 family)
MTDAAEIRRRVQALSAEQRVLLADRLRARAAGAEEAGAGGAKLVAYLVPAEGREGAPDPDALRRFLRERLPDAMVPAGFVTLAELPRLPNGKVDPHALPAPEPAHDEPEAAYVPPRNATERALAEIWGELLGTDRIGAHDNFFEIGGDSILSIQVVARASRAGLTLTPDHLFQYPTVARLATVVGIAAAVTAEQGPVTGSAPLTPIQHWFFEQPLPEPNHWHQALWLEVAAEVSGARLEEAVRHLVLHHDALRLRFTRDAGGWRQVHGLPEVLPSVGYVDLSGRSGPEQERVLRGAVDELAASTDLARQPPIQVRRFHRGGGRADRLLIAIHHLVVDPISWGILLEDLEAACARLALGMEVVLPAKTTSYRAWAEALVAHAGSEALRKEREFWSSLPAEPPRLSVDYPGVFTEASAATVTTALDPEETRALLLDAPGAYNTNPEELLLTALAQTLGAWLGEARLLVGLERHGREAVAEGIDLSRTVGWFTSFFPVLLDLMDARDPGTAIKAVKEQLRRLPGRGIGYGVLRYLGSDGGTRERLRAHAQPEVIFNYSRWSEAARATGTCFRRIGPPTISRGPHNRRGHLLEINAFAAEDRLQLHWSYSTEIHRRATIEQLAQRHLEALRTLVFHCSSPGTGGYTPSDFPEAGLNQEELDRFLDGLLS